MVTKDCNSPVGPVVAQHLGSKIVVLHGGTSISDYSGWRCSCINGKTTISEKSLPCRLDHRAAAAV